jgi:hypothetical protein
MTQLYSLEDPFLVDASPSSSTDLSKNLLLLMDFTEPYKKREYFFFNLPFLLLSYLGSQTF